MVALRREWQSFWAKLSASFLPLTYLLKAWGMQCLNFLMHNQKQPEGPKYVMRKSFWIAASRCAVHILPAGFCVFISYLCFVNIFIGPGFSVEDRSDSAYLIAYQIAAKFLELLSIASMTVIVLHHIRHGLLNGDGVSLGLLTSHLWCSKPQSVLSPEYLSAAGALLKDCLGTTRQCLRGKWAGCEVIRQRFRRIQLLSLVSFAIVGATLIGPLSAVLLIPRAQNFNAGRTTYNLNATGVELWPELVDSTLELDLCRADNASTYPVCPSGGFYTVRDQWNLNTIYDSTGFRPSADGSTEAWWAYSSTDPWGLLPKLSGLGNDRNGALGGYMPTIATQPNHYTAVIIQMLLRDWVSAARQSQKEQEGHPGSLRSARSFVHASFSASVVSRYPITGVRCSIAQNLSASATTFGFHHFRPNARFVDTDNFTYGGENNTLAVDITGLQRQPSPHLRTQWVDLPTDVFGPVSTGLLFEMPWSSSNTSRVAVGCTVVAAWCTSYLSYTLYEVKPDLPGCEARPVKMVSNEEDVAWEAYNRLIRLDRTWLDLLSPKAPALSVTENNWESSTTLDMILEAAGFDTMLQDSRWYPSTLPIDYTCEVEHLDPNMTDMEIWNMRVCNQADKVVFIERTLVRVINDGLSRRLSHRAFDITPNLRSWSVRSLPRADGYNHKLLGLDRGGNAIVLDTDTTRLTQTLYVYVYGYGYAATTTVDHIAIGVVLTYACISLMHVVWTMYRRISSSSWESPLELLLLAWNSPPVEGIKATSAQIERWQTYNHTTKVAARAVPMPNTPSVVEMHLQMVLESDPSDPSTIGHGSTHQNTSIQQGERVKVDKKYY